MPAQEAERAAQVMVLGDGAGWIGTIRDHHFPQAELRLRADTGDWAQYWASAKQRP